jgi:hypothetical protein
MQVLESEWSTLYLKDHIHPPPIRTSKSELAPGQPSKVEIGLEKLFLQGVRATLSLLLLPYPSRIDLGTSQGQSWAQILILVWLVLVIS